VALFALALLACDGPSGGPGGPVYPTVDTGAGGCTPDCHFKGCGDDGCGGICGYCGSPYQCSDFQCVLPSGVDAAGSPDAGGGATDQDVAPPEPDVPAPTGSDGDGDGVDDALDNCKTVYNPNQSDLDGDYIGDACDPDMDNDGTLNAQDCKPTDPKVHPDAKERCDNAVDDDCNGLTDEENAWDCVDYFVDADDSDDKRCLCAKSPPHVVKVAGDCNDGAPGYSPLLAESCDNIDNNCNLLIDEGCDDDGDGYCDANMPIFGTPNVCPGGGGDCYDYSADVFPGAPEIEGDDIDNDCDGVKAGEPTGGPIDCSCASACVTTSPTTDDFLCAMDMCCSNLVINKSVSSPTADTIGGAWGPLRAAATPSSAPAPSMARVTRRAATRSRALDRPPIPTPTTATTRCTTRWSTR
jgi:hypothetical protein